MRPVVALLFAGAGLAYLLVAVWPFQAETRLVGMGGALVFGVLLVAERRRGRRHHR